MPWMTIKYKYPSNLFGHGSSPTPQRLPMNILQNSFSQEKTLGKYSILAVPTQSMVHQLYWKFIQKAKISGPTPVPQHQKLCSWAAALCVQQNLQVTVNYILKFEKPCSSLNHSHILRTTQQSPKWSPGVRPWSSKLHSPHSSQF